MLLCVPWCIFETNERGEYVVKNRELCFGCTACPAQCSYDGVVIVPNELNEHITIESLLQ